MTAIAVEDPIFSTKRDFVCEGYYYFDVYEDGEVYSSLPPSNIVCDVIVGSLYLYNYSESYENLIPKSIKSIKKINGTLILNSLREYPAFLNSTNEIGAIELYNANFDVVWTLSQLKRLYNYIEIYPEDIINMRFPNLIELGGIVMYFPSSAFIDAPLLKECGTVEYYGFDEMQPTSILRNVQKINGNLYIELSTLSSLGMDSLISITGNFVIATNNNVSNLVFHNRVDIGGDLEISYNFGDVGIHLLNRSANIQGSLLIHDNKKEVDLRGFGEAKVGDSIKVYNNFEKVNLFDVSSLTRINGTLEIYNNRLMDFPVFASLERVGGINIPNKLRQTDSLDIYYPKLRSVEGVVLVYRCNFLVNLTAVKSLENIGSLFVEDNKKLISLGGLEHTNILKSLDIQNNQKLRSLTGLSNLVNFDGYLHIGHNDRLVSLDGLNSMKSVGSLSIEYNKKLKSIRGLNNLERVDGVMSITNNNRLITLDGLKSLKSVGSLSIGYNNKMKSLSGLDELTSINGTLSITDNKALETTDGINKLEQVESIEMNMYNQQNIKEIIFGEQKSNLGHPIIEIFDVGMLKYLTVKDIKKSFLSICKEINKISKSIFICNMNK